MSPYRPLVSARRARGFTLVEILVSMAVLAVLLLITANVISQVQKTWSAAAARTSQFREARVAFEILSRNLRQATLGAYVDYDFNYLVNGLAGTGTAPSRYLRKSDLHFVSGPTTSLISGNASAFPGHAVFFQAPLGVVQDPNFSGLESLLCGRGYFVQFSDDAAFRPPFVNRARQRYRLMEFSPPSEQNLIYSVVAPGASDAQRAQQLRGWFANAGQAMVAEGANAAVVSQTRPISDNILMLIVSAQLDPSSVASAGQVTAIAPNYTYDSAVTFTAGSTSQQGTQNQLPPLLRVALVAIDEVTADRLDQAGLLQGLAQINGADFTNAANMDADLQRVAVELAERNINYRIFTASIPLLSSKWGL